MLSQLKEFAPAGNPRLLQALARANFAKYGVTTPLRMAHFMAQLYVESWGLRKVEESLSYTAPRLMKVWPSRFPSLSVARQYERNPQKLANKVYGGRMGNTGANDGWMYRGRGPKSITGKDNYRKVGRPLGLDLVADPDLLLDYDIGVEAALVYWQLADCNRYADKNDIRGVTKAVNGGYIGLADRRAAFRKATEIWGDDSFSEIGGKGPLSSNTGKAALAGGGMTVAGIADQAREISVAVESGKSVADAVGVNFISLILLAGVLGLIAYIIYDRKFMAKHEGL